MESSPDLVFQPEHSQLGSTVRRRKHLRYTAHSLVYVQVDEINGGIIRELGESGMAIHTVAPLQRDQDVRLRFELLNPRTRVESAARVVWTDASGQAGLQFEGLSPRYRRLIRDWLFTQLLAGSQHGTLNSPIFRDRQPGENEELIFSPGSRPTIVLVTDPRPHPPKELRKIPKVDLSWWPVPISLSSFSRLVDGLVIFAAVLLFSVSAVAVTHMSPRWPLALAMTVVVAVAFGFAYRILFRLCQTGTVGTYLALMAAADAGREVRKISQEVVTSKGEYSSDELSIKHDPSNNDPPENNRPKNDP